MIRVALDYRPALTGGAGIARAARELARALAARAPTEGLELHLFGHGLRRARAAAVPAGAALHRRPLPGRSLPLLARLGLEPARLAGRAQVFHALDYLPLPRAGAPLVFTLHDLAFLDDPRWHGARAARALQRRSARLISRARAVVCPSRASAAALDRARARGHLPPGPPARVIPFGADHGPAGDAAAGRALAQRLLGTREPFLLVLGTLEPRKNHAALLDALDLLEGRGRVVPALVAGAPGWGTPGLVERLRARARTRPFAWLRAPADRAVFDLLRAARALAYPSSLEGFGFPPLEALARGTPVLAGDCPALREVLGPAALFAPGDRPQALAAALERILDDEKLHAAQRAAWAVRAPALTWAACARAHVQLYREVAP